MAKYPVCIAGVMSRVWEVGHSDRPLVLVHDISLRADWWRNNLKALGAAGLRAISFDLPGHGFADKDPNGAHAFNNYARFVTAFCHELGLTRPILAGAGVGAQVAAMAACDGLEVAGLVLSSPTGVVPLDPQYRAAISQALFDTSRAGAARRIAALVSDTGTTNEDWADEEYEVCASPGQAAVFEKLKPIVAESLARPIGPQLMALTAAVPTLVLWGAKDALMPVSLMPSVVAHLGGAVQQTVIEGAGHAPQFDQPDAYNAAVAAFTGGFGR